MKKYSLTYKTVLLISLILGNINIFANISQDRFILENRMNSFIQMETNTITEVEFINIIDKISNYYKQVFNNKGARLIVQKLWKAKIKNAIANNYMANNQRQYHLLFFGGLARQKVLTLDAFALVVCHEFGHFLGGAPKKNKSSASSIEGQADYWATSKCLKNIFYNDDNISIVKSLNPSKYIKKLCAKVYNSNLNEENLCLRIALAGLSTVKMMQKLAKKDVKVSYSTPSKKVVSKTFMSHPDFQCRLDTYLQGALCDKANESNSDTDEDIGNCISKDGVNILGARPKCWYANSTFY